MSYIKHSWKFYKEVRLEDLSKEELVELITNAKEVKPEVIEKITRVYESYPRYKPYYWSINAVSTNLNGKSNLDTYLSQVDRHDLLSIASTL